MPEDPKLTKLKKKYEHDPWSPVNYGENRYKKWESTCKTNPKGCAEELARIDCVKQQDGFKKEKYRENFDKIMDCQSSVQLSKGKR